MAMRECFADVVNMSITASAAMGFVVLARLGLRKSPRVFSYVLWAVVLFRALCPVSLTVDFSLLRLADAPVAAVGEGTSTVKFVPEGTFFPESEWKEIPEEMAVPEEGTVLTAVWLAGTCVMTVWGLWSLIRLKRKLREGAALGWRVWECDGLDTAFVMGLARPRIYLPSGLTEQERRFILLHEEHHIRRMDHVWKIAGYGALCVHWFNPLMWLAFRLAQKDMEISCDEAVLKTLDADCRCDYSQTLLRVSSRRRWTAAMPLAFGEGNVKERVVNVLKWKKPRMWVSVMCGMVCAVLIAACGGNPVVETTLPEETPAQETERFREEEERFREELERLKGELALRKSKTNTVPVDVELNQNAYTVDVELTEYANIRLKLPQGWIYEKVEPELETVARGIRFWPAEYPEVLIELCWYPTGFGVCGFGLETVDLETDCGRMASLGFYDGNDAMSFCAYGMNYAAVNVSTEDKWEEYGDTILGILKSVELNRGVISEEDALAEIQKLGMVQQEWKHYRSEFDPETGEWTFRFYENEGGDAVQVICVDHQGSCWHHGDVRKGEGDHSGHHHDW